MSTSILNFTLMKSPETKYSDAQIFLQEFTGNSFSRTDAEDIWSKVIDHKWNISANLKRDVGLRVAAVDFVENFYAPHHRTEIRNQRADFSARASKDIKKIVRRFFEAMGQSLNY